MTLIKCKNIKVNYINNHTKVDIICSKHGSFSQTPNVHLTNHGCPRCKSSKGNRNIFEYLSNKKILFIGEKTFDRYSKILEN